jgi:predicted protein tyrosine phosphatase
MASEDISLIVPYVYIGNRYAATGRFGPDGYIDYLRRYRIQHVISILTDAEYADYMIAAEDFADQRAWHRLVVDDEPQEPISRFFSQMADVIANAVAARQPILVHCAAGMSRSVTLVAAYLIAEKHLFGLMPVGDYLSVNAPPRTPAQALTIIKNKRPIADPNKGFMRQLEIYYNLLYR